MAFRAEQGRDLIVGCEEPSRLTRGFEAPHDFLSSPGVSMHGFGPIVQPLMLAMFDPGGDLAFGRGIGSELVRDQHARLAPLPEQFSKEAFGRARVPTRLDQDIQHIAIGVDRPPEPVLRALDRDHDLAEMAFVRRAGALATDPSGELRTKARDPVPHGLIGHADPA